MIITLSALKWGIALIAIHTFIAYLQGRRPSIGICLLIGILTFIAGIIPKPTTLSGGDNTIPITSTPRMTENVAITPTEEAWVVIYGNINAPASDFLFPESRDEYLTPGRLNEVLASDNQMTRIRRSQMAINEMLARYGYEFKKQNSRTADDAREKFCEKDWYQHVKGIFPSDIQKLYDLYFTEIERENFDALIEWQKMNDADYYIDDYGNLYRD